MYLEDQILELASTTSSLSELLNIYDKCLKTHGLKSTSNQAMELYTSIIRKFKNRTILAKQDMDPNMFSFGKMDRINVKRIQGLEKQLFSNTNKINKIQNGKHKSFNINKYKQQTNNDDILKKSISIEKITNVISSRRKISELITTQRSIQQSPIKNSFVYEALLSQSKQNEEIQDFQDKLKQFRLKKFFLRFSSYRNNLKSMDIIKLHALTFNYLKNKKRVKQVFIELLQNVQILKQKQQQLINSLQLINKQKYMMSLVNNITHYNQNKILKQDFVMKSNFLRFKLFFMRFQNKKILAQNVNQIEYKINTLQRVLLIKNQQKLFNILIAKQQQFKQKHNLLNNKLNTMNKNKVFTLMVSIISNKHEWIKSNGNNKLLSLVEFIQNIISKSSFENNIKVLVQQQFVQWKQSKPINKILENQTLLRTFNTLKQNYKQQERKKMMLNRLIIKNRFELLKTNIQSQILIHIKQNQLLQSIICSRIKLALDTLAISSFRSSSQSISVLLKYNNIFRGFNAMKNNLIKNHLSKDLNYQIERFRYIQVLRMYFEQFKKQIQTEKCEQQIVQIIQSQKNKKLLKTIFMQIKQNMYQNKIIGIKEQSLIKIRQRRQKQAFFTCLRRKQNQNSISFKQLKRCFQSWKIYCIYHKKRKQLSDNLLNDYNISILGKCFDTLKVHSFLCKQQHKKQKILQKKQSTKLKSLFFKILVNGSLISVKTRIIVQKLQNVLIRKYFKILCQYY